MRDREQKLVDIMYEIGITCATNPWFKGKTPNEIGEWISGQLCDMGFKVEPCGSKHGVLCE